MGKYDPWILRILRGASDANISFRDLCQLLGYLGFDERIRGGHHIFRNQGIEEKINPQQDSGFGPIAPAELKKIADDNGVEICATHIGFDRMRDDTQAVIDEHLLWNCKYPAIGSLPQSYREDGEAGYLRFAKDASEVGRKLADAGLTFAYHNHNFEFQKYGTRTALEIILQESDPKAVQLEIDVYWVQAGGADPAAWIRKAKTRIDLVHVKDMAIEGREARFAKVGEGNLNWPAIFEAGRESGTRWYIVEQDRCYDRDPFDSLKISYDNLVAMGLS